MSELAAKLGGNDPELTVVIVSYNTCILTLAAVRTLLANSPGLAMRVVVFDNASEDRSAEVIREHFPEIEVIANKENIGFAAANNRVAETVTTPYLCLLNPDTETYLGAMRALLEFAKSRPEAGIVGGRTVFRDGKLNPASCWGRFSLWSLITSLTGVSRIFPRSSFFNPEAIGGWERDSIREVDVVVGCLMLVRTDVWRELGGFDERFFMYGEDADLSLRARKLGYRPMITPDATIMHIVGASTKRRADKVCTVMQAKATLLRHHWPKRQVPLGLALLWIWAAVRGLAGLVHPDPEERDRFRQIWIARKNWLAGFPKKLTT